MRCGLLSRDLLDSQLLQHRQRCLDTVSEVAQGLPRPLQTLLLALQQGIDGPDERPHLGRYLFLQLGDFTLFEAGDVVCSGRHGAQRARDDILLDQQQDQQHGQRPGQQAPLEVSHSVAHGGEVLGHTDLNHLALLAVGARPEQQ